MNFTLMEEELLRDEGLRLRPYTCSAGHLTIGVGHKITGRENLGDTISLEVAGSLLTRDIASALAAATRIFGRERFESFSEARQRAVINMIFNLGEDRFRGFKRMIAAIIAGDWKDAAAHCLDSKYAQQVGERSKRVANQLRAGGA
jgi:lysozyme